MNDLPWEQPVVGDPPPRWRTWGWRLLTLMCAATVVTAAAIGLRIASVPRPAIPLSAEVQVTQRTTPSSTGAASVGSTPASRVDPTWAHTVSQRTGIPVRAVNAYASAQLRMDADQPGCGIGWNTVAAIGNIESAHGTHDGANLGDDGYSNPPIRGVALDGNGVGRIADTDGGRWDGDKVWDRAVGPMQFIPSTWQQWGADGNGDGVANPNQIDDAALGAARYLCDAGNLSNPGVWREAVLRYNRSIDYVDSVAQTATVYAQQAAGQR